MNRAYRVAVICGALPLIVGISIFVLWLIMRWEWLMLAGIFTLYGGVAIFLVGAAALGRFCWLAFRTPELPRRRLWLSTLGCAALLLSNFVVAGGIVMAAVAINSRYTVIIYNFSQQPLSSVRVFGGGCEEEFGNIPAGGTVYRSFRIQRDGALEFHAVSEGAPHAMTIDGYVSKNMNCITIVTINPDGTISVSKD